ncbi:heat shock 70 kDa protein 12B-like [Mercenaria mercenaria]|uniref:heat shock 70 kDa protein 12B-like n=1 Tax=Mercenaria mercenaria TaxID=6596 RepID=UPI00234E984D|nr:heat shock 70 kDa protein 12B-like [Mercenaria mercenaria]
MSVKACNSGDYLLVCAIDFGTTFSGYAFSMKHDYIKDPLNIATNNWIGQSLISQKAPSTVLCRPNGDFHSFGYEAEGKFCDLANDDKHHGWFFFRQFKMIMHSQKELKRATLLHDHEGKSMPALDVFAMCLRYIRKHLLDAIDKQGMSLKDNEVVWVITVPAIWSDPAKQFMREAAVQSGISNEHLILALEPEAASIYCKRLPIDRLAAGSTLPGFNPGITYMVLDIGGGTADVTVHKILSDGSLTELHKASGGAWGGTRVDQAFRMFLKKTFGSKVMKRFAEEFHIDDFDLSMEFEVKKRRISLENTSEITVRIPVNLMVLFKEETKRPINDILKRNGFDDKVTIKGDKMRIDANIFRDFFTESVESIIAHVRDILRSPRSNDISTILMVGGFSESPLLQDMIRRAFPEKTLVIPHDAGTAVLKGAVMYGHQPKIVTSRISKFTYGVNFHRDFDPKLHLKEKRVVIDGDVLCKDIFLKFVRVGDTLKLGEKRSHTFIETFQSPERKRMIEYCNIFASTDPKPNYIDDENCWMLGRVAMLPPKNGWPDKIEGRIEMVFGMTEFEVTVFDEISGQQFNANFDLLK